VPEIVVRAGFAAAFRRNWEWRWIGTGGKGRVEADGRQHGDK